MAKPTIVVSALLERTYNGQRQVFIQTRFQETKSVSYLNTFEIPTGEVNGYDNVYEILKREVEKETGLELIRVIGDEPTGVLENIPGEKSMAFRPFMCQQVLKTNDGLPWFGFVFLCEARGEIKQERLEAKKPQWMSLKNLKQIMDTQPEKIFPLQFATLQKYLQERG
jgi:8-oxo-dGTP pyrophosphatase MutT (NUDIX family)